MRKDSCYNHTMKQTKQTTEKKLALLTGPLLAWYRENARDLPWRRTDDPYRIWVSEIMLQQTRVAAVLGYYDRFLESFPTVEALAGAPEELLLKRWEGLGYYSRARNLQKAAQLVTERYGGRFPTDYDALRTLPGIGEYTAGAVASAAFGVREPAVDGNVLRVVTRITDCHDDIADPKTKRDIRQQVAAAMPARAEDIRVYNQAVMELGATVCVPNGAPKCTLCPAQPLCLARERGTIAQLPVKAPKKERRREGKTVFLLLRDCKVALRRRNDSGLLAGLWEFPNVEGVLEEAAAASVLAGWGLEIKAWEKQLSAKHIFSHVEWEMTGYSLQVTGEGPAEILWADAETLERCAVPSAFAKYYAEAKKLLSAERSGGTL